MRSEGEFSRALTDPAQPVPAGLASSDGLPPKRRFDVYRNNVVVSLCEALAETLPTVRQMVGAEFFAAMAREFIRESPPRSPVLSEYGADFPAFLAGFEPVAALPYLPDLARLEFAQVRAFHAADAAPLAPESLRAVPPAALPGLRFRPHPASRVLVSSFAIASLWFAHHGQGEIEAVDLGRPEEVLVTRPALSVQVYRLPVGAGLFFTAILAGKPLGEAVAEAFGEHLDFDLTGALALLVESGATCAMLPERKAADGPN